ncbi:MAG: hypothetical protein AB1921_04500 [Thermodesulfobacteriota bacterium]
MQASNESSNPAPNPSDLPGEGDLLFKMKVALVKTVAAQENPSLSVLHKTVMEEFGRPATPDLVQLFQKEVARREKKKEEITRTAGESALELVRSVVAQDEPSTEKLQQVFLEKRGERPSPAIVAFFRAELRRKAVVSAGVKVATGKSKIELLRNVVSGDNPSMEKLTETFQREFGMPVPPELVAVFNIEMQKLEAKKLGLSLAEYLVRQAQQKITSQKKGR